MGAIEIIRKYVTTQLLQRSGLDLTDDAPLVEDGYLTSLETVDLVVFMEEKFGIEIDPEEVNEKDFRDLRSIAGLVERKLADSHVGNGR